MSNSKKKIALLFSSLASFEPEMDGGKWTGRYIVNQSKIDKLGEPPDLNEILTRIGQASVELKDFLQQTEILARNGSMLSSFVMQADNMLNGLITGIQDKDLVEKMAILVGRYRQMYDLLHQIAHDLPEKEGKRRAANFLLWKGQELTLPVLTTLVNQNSTNGQENITLLAEEKPRPGDAYAPGTINTDHQS